MKTQKILVACLLLSGIYGANAQIVENTSNTGAGFENGANYAGGNNNQNSFFGHRAGKAATAANSQGMNTFIGSEAGTSNTAGNHNTFVGKGSGLSSTVGSANTFVGANSGANNINGTENVFVGLNSGIANQSSGYNVYLGNHAGSKTTSGDGGNVFLGHAAGTDNISGSGNTYLGFTTGMHATGNGNVFIGSGAGSNCLLSNKLFIANNDTSTPLVFGDFTSNKLGIGGINTFPATAGSANVSTYSLFVKGGILTEEVRVSIRSGWADYVFAPDYKLYPLSEVEAFIKKNNHLPNVPSALEVTTDGISLGDMSKIQQEKIEELTLYAIEQEKKLNDYKAELDELRSKLTELLSKTAVSK